MWHTALSFCALLAAGVFGALLQEPTAEYARALLRKR